MMMNSNEPCSIVEITISCSKLKNMDILSKSDPMCVVWIQKAGTQVWREIGRTEVVMDNLNPEFSKKISMTYLFEERQLLKFEVYDIDSNSKNLADHDFIGRIEVSLGEIVSCSSIKAYEKDLLSARSHSSGKIKLIAEELPSFKEAYSFSFGATDLPKKMFGVSSFFYEIHKATESSGMSLVFRSETLASVNKRTVEWKLTQISMHTLCNGDVDRNLRITLYKHKSNGSHRRIGECNATARTMSESPLPLNLKLSSSKTVLKLIAFNKGSHSTFLDFIKKGVQMHCSLAVDFTQSNGDPRQPSSLHYMNPNQPNQYQTALRAVLEIIQDYDSDKLFPCLGFGAQVPPDWGVSHEFFLNFHPTNPYCEGVDGVLAAYTNTLLNVRLYGPTNFAPVINHVSRFAHANKEGKNYFILLILTDGVISDFAQAKNAIVAASSLPMSIIIVGVGNADFSAMEELDADDKPLVSSSGTRMERDIVQFVPFNSIIRKAGGNISMAKIDLAREVLAEVPGQFLSFMKKIEMTPEKLAALS